MAIARWEGEGGARQPPGAERPDPRIDVPSPQRRPTEGAEKGVPRPKD
jgi:hypothetical protein